MLSLWGEGKERRKTGGSIEQSPHIGRARHSSLPEPFPTRGQVRLVEDPDELVDPFTTGRGVAEGGRMLSWVQEDDLDVFFVCFRYRLSWMGSEIRMELRGLRFVWGEERGGSRGVCRCAGG
jgi:hypothetical protein